MDFFLCKLVEGFWGFGLLWEEERSRVEIVVLSLEVVENSFSPSLISVFISLIVDLETTMLDL